MLVPGRALSAHISSPFQGLFALPETLSSPFFLCLAEPYSLFKDHSPITTSQAEGGTRSSLGATFTPRPLYHNDGLLYHLFLRADIPCLSAVPGQDC